MSLYSIELKGITPEEYQQIRERLKIGRAYPHVRLCDAADLTEISSSIAILTIESEEKNLPELKQELEKIAETFTIIQIKH